MRSGWFKIPGVQEGIVSFEDQVLALWPAITGAYGKTVLDLGCAEGLLGREFARAGSPSVIGLDSIAEHLAVAWDQCKGWPMQFVLANINDPQPVYSADIVLALGVIHKLRRPEVGLRFAAKSSTGLVLLRSGRGAANGVIKGKHSGVTCDSHAIMKEEGFSLEKVVEGPKSRQEDVEYWHRTC